MISCEFMPAAGGKFVATNPSLPLLENKKHCQPHQYKTYHIVPGKLIRLENKNGADGKHCKRDHFLQHLQLKEIEGSAELVAANAVSGNHKDVFKKSDAPADKNDSNQTCIREDIPFFELQVSVPGKRHEEI